MVNPRARVIPRKGSASSSHGKQFALSKLLLVAITLVFGRFISLLREGSSVNFRRLLLHPFFAAVTTLLNNIIDHPSFSQVKSDLDIVEPFLRLLEILSADKKVCSRSDDAQRMCISSNELKGRAEEAIKGENSALLP
jgi:hypothetical protein